MNRVTLVILVLCMASLACTQAVVTFTPTAPAATPTAPSVTPEPSRTPAPSVTEEGTAKVKAAIVNVRQLPNGDVIGHLEAGQEVTVIVCTDSWCEVQTADTHGYIWEGCLDVETELKCEAR